MGGSGVLQHFKPLDVRTGKATSDLFGPYGPMRKQNDDYPAGNEEPYSELVSLRDMVSSLSQQHPACVSRVVGWSPEVPSAQHRAWPAPGTPE